jgi:hypothetical protein
VITEPIEEVPLRVILRSTLLGCVLLLGACGASGSGSGGSAQGPGPDPHAGDEACSPDACEGPRPLAPNHPCPDGRTIAGPACQRDAHGRCAWTLLSCPDAPPSGDPGAGGAMCGGIAAVQCPSGQVCIHPREARCGAGDQSGVCRTLPEACAEIFQPVCGCDGRTYGNECEATRAGVSVAADGECAGAGGGSTGGGERACGSRGLAPCGADEYCDWPPSAQCGAADAPGVCRPRPRMCTREYRPVCGCDGQTHPTACVAASAGVSVAHDGPC